MDRGVLLPSHEAEVKEKAEKDKVTSAGRVVKALLEELTSPCLAYLGWCFSPTCTTVTAAMSSFPSSQTG